MTKKRYPIVRVSSGEYLGLEYLNSKFYHYTRFASFLEIKKRCFFKLSNIALSCNDTDELGRNIFTICFCRTQNEKVPFWLNYATTDDGIALRLTCTMMNKLISSFNNLYCLKDNVFNILYSNFNGYRVTCGCCEYVNSKFDVNNYFHKRKAWSYENEFRIIVELDNSITDDLYIKLDKKLFDSFYKLLSPSSKRRGNNYKKSKLGINFNLIKTYSHQIPSYLESLPHLGQDEIVVMEKVKNILKPILGKNNFK